MGERAVPADALYGIHTVRAVENLGFSGRILANYPDYIRALATVKKAAARANRDAHVIDARRLDAIERACDALIRGEHLAQFPVDMLAGGGSIAVNMNLNEVIANLASEYLGGARGTYQPVHPKLHVNASQSTADVCHTAVRMTVLSRWRGLRRGLAECVAAFRAKAEELRPVITISRTCLQDASRVSLGEIFGAHAEVIERRAGELSRSIRALTQINLGGTVDWLWKRSIGDLSARDPEAAERTRRAEAYAAAQSLRRGAEYRRSRGGVRATRDARGSDD